MYVEDGEIIKLFSESGQTDNCADDPFDCSDADTMLAYLESR
jgi:peroxiredoxin